MNLASLRTNDKKQTRSNTRTATTRAVASVVDEDLQIRERRGGELQRQETLQARTGVRGRPGKSLTGMEPPGGRAPKSSLAARQWPGPGPPAGV